MDEPYYAIIGYWDFDKALKVYNCKEFFLVPNPIGRHIVDDRTSIVREVLFTGKQDEVFLFFNHKKVRYFA